MANPMLLYAPLNGSLAFQDRAGGGTLTGTGAVRYAPASGARTNLVKNPSFETNTSGWDVVGSATLTRITNDGSSGSCSLEVTSSTATMGGGSNRLGATGVAKVSKVPHTLSFDAWLVSGAGDWQVRFTECNAAGSVIATSTATDITVVTEKRRFALVYTPSATGVDFIQVQFIRKTSVAGTIRIDAVVIETGSTVDPVPSYFDGSTGGVWLDPITGMLGTAHASPSVSQAVAWVEEGTTNLIPDPLTNNNPTGSQIRGAGTNVLNTDYGRSTAFACTGSGSWWRSGDGVNSGRGIQQNTASALGYTGSVRMFSAQAKVRVTGGPYSIVIAAQIRYTDATFSTAVTQTLSIGDAWTLVKLTGLATNAAKTVDYIVLYAYFNGTPSASVILYMTDMQIEEKTVCTTFCAGSLGTGYAWAGTAHASASTRTKCDISVEVGSRVRHSRGAMAALGAYNYVSPDGTQYFVVAGDWGTAGQDGIGLAPYANNGPLMRGLYRVGAGSVTYVGDDATSPGVSSLGYTSWNGTEVDAAKDSETPVSATRDTPAGAMTGTLYIGSRAGNFYLNGPIGPVATFEDRLTDAERSRLNANSSWTWDIINRPDGSKSNLALGVGL